MGKRKEELYRELAILKGIKLAPGARAFLEEMSSIPTP